MRSRLSRLLLAALVIAGIGLIGVAVADDGADDDRDRIAPGLENAIEAAEANQTMATDASEPDVDVLVRTSADETSAATTAIEDHGGTVASAYGSTIFASLPPSAIEPVAAVDDVQSIQQPPEPEPAGTVGDDDVSEGVETMGADELHEHGVNGSDVTIAVLDTHFDPDNPKYEEMVVDEYPDNSVYKDESGLHGTASAEVVADVAPDAELVLVSVWEGNIFSAVDYLQDIDVDVATMSMSYGPTLGPLDGTDDLSQRIRDAEARGMTWFTSAGNYADRQSWNGTVTDGPDDALEFEEGEDRITVRSVGGDEHLFVTWDAWGQHNEYYDVLVYDPETDDEDPIERYQPEGYVTEIDTSVFADELSGGEFELAIEKGLADDYHEVSVLTWDDLQVDPWNEQQSLMIPATSEYVASVGAVHVDTFSADQEYQESIASYSSQGPTIDGRLGVDLTAPSSVSSYDWGLYAGTSAATPHAAGAGALVQEGGDVTSPRDIREHLEETTHGLDDEDEPPNERIGHGVVDAYDAVVDATDRRVHGTVTDVETDEPLEDVTVTAYDESDSPVVNTTSDDDGAYELTGLPTGEFDVTFEREGFENWTETVALDLSNESVERDVALGDLPGSIEGTVTDEFGGHGVAEVAVTIDNGTEEVTAETDEDGEYRFDSVSRDEYELDLDGDGYEPVDDEVVVGPGENVTVNESLTGNETLQGTVVDDYDHGPIENATVAATDGDLTYDDATNESGAYEIRLPGGTYDVTTDASGFHATTSESVDAADSEPVDVTLDPEDGDVEVVVIDAFDDAAIEDATVDLGDESPVTTDANGTASIDDVPRGNHSIDVEAQEYQSNSTTIEVGPGESVQTTVALTGEPGTIAGTVHDAGTDEPFENGSVSLESTTTGVERTVDVEDGAFAIEDVDRDEYAVTADVDGFYAATETIEVGPNATVDDDRTVFELEPRPATVAGTITDAESGEGVYAATVEARNESGATVDHTETDANGTYELVVERGEYDLDVTQPSFDANDTEVALEAGENRSGVDLTLDRDDVFFEVVDLDVPSTATEDDTFTATATIENAGEENGTQPVNASIGDESTESENVSLAAGENTTVEFELPAGEEGDANVSATSLAQIETAQVSVEPETDTGGGGGGAPPALALDESPETGDVSLTIVSTVGDQPIPDAEVTLDGPVFDSTVTDQDGRTVIELEPGTYEVEAESPGYETSSQTITVDDSDHQDHQLTLEPDLGSITGEVSVAGESVLPEGATVVATHQETDETVETEVGPDGAFELSEVPPGAYEVGVEADGYQPNSESVQVEPGESTDDVELSLDADETDKQFPVPGFGAAVAVLAVLGTVVAMGRRAE